MVRRLLGSLSVAALLLLLTTQTPIVSWAGSYFGGGVPAGTASVDPGSGTTGVIPKFGSNVLFDSLLSEPSTDLVVQRRTTNVQEFRVYGEDDGGGNEQYIQLLAQDGSGNALIRSHRTGTGTQHALRLSATGNVANLILAAADTDYLRIRAAGTIESLNGSTIGAESFPWPSFTARDKIHLFADQVSDLMEIEFSGNPAEDSFVNSPSLVLTGVYDALAGAGITRTEVQSQVFTAPLNTAGDYQLRMIVANGNEIRIQSNGALRFLTANTERWQMSTAALFPNPADIQTLGTSAAEIKTIFLGDDKDSIQLGVLQDIIIGRDAPDTLRVIGGTPAATKVVLVSDDTANFQRMELDFSGGDGFIRMLEAAGTGRNLTIGTVGAATRVSIVSGAGNPHLIFQGNLNRFSMSADNTIDFGGIGARWRDVYVGREIIGMRSLTQVAQAAVVGSPATNEVRQYIREDLDQGAGTGTADCALVAKLNDATEILIVVLVTDGGCP